MVARLFRLRLALLASAFRGGPRRLARNLLIGVVAVLVAIGIARLPQWFAASAADRSSLGVFIGALLLLLIALVPLFARLDNLEPRQFAGYPVSPANIAVSLFVTTVCSWPALWLLFLMIVLVASTPEWAESPWAVTAWAILTLLLAIVFVRLSSAIVRLAVPRKALSVLRWVGLLLLLAALPVIVFMVADILGAKRSSTISDAAQILGWTPFGAPLAGLEFVTQGDVQAAAAHFAVALVAVIVLLAAWYLVVARSVTSIERPAPEGLASDGLELFERFPARPRDVIAARSLTYWRRDPRYRVALFAIPLAPVAMLGALWVAGVDASVLALLPLPIILLLLGWSVHNDIALDSTAIWMHVASGTRGRDDRAGRLAPVMLIGLPLAIIGSSITVTFSGNWHILSAVLGMNLAVLLVASGVSSVFSALMPYPATRPGDSPFAQPAVQGSGAGLSQTLAMVFAIVLSAPALVLSIRAIIDPTFAQNIVALAFGVVWGLLLLGAGILLGGRIFERSAPELVALTQTFD